MSKSAEQVYALLVDANPIPDVDAVPETLQPAPHLRVIDPRRDDMQTQTRPLRPETTPPKTPQRPGVDPGDSGGGGRHRRHRHCGTGIP